MTNQSETEAARTEDAGPRAWTLCLVAVAAAVLAATTYRSVLALGHLGWDTYPMILTSRVQSASDFFGTFTEILMEGRYRITGSNQPAFYRPVANLSLALDYAVWGLTAKGYHMTNLAVLVGGAVGVFLVGRRLFQRAWLGVVAGLLYIVHPMHFEALPVTARRADSLSVMFTLFALALLPRACTKRPRLRIALCAVACLCAVASKETGVIAVALVLALSLVETEGGLVARALGMLKRAGPSAAVVGGYLLARSSVVGGLGGHASSSLVEGLQRGPALLPSYSRSLLLPQPIVDNLATQATFAGTVGLALVVLFARALFHGRKKSTALQTLAFSGLWLLALLGITGISGEEQAWYAIAFMPLYALILGTVAYTGYEALRARRWLLGVPTAAVALFLAGTLVFFSGLSKRYEDWNMVDRGIQSFLANFTRQVDSKLPGERIVLRGMPMGKQTPPGQFGIRSAAGIFDYSIQAYAELTMPEKAVWVVAARGSMPQPRSNDEVLVVVAP